MANQPPVLDLTNLQEAVTGHAAAFRCRLQLQPAGGPGDKVFPPTYEGGQYAVEDRVIGGQRVPCVLLDSVQSQANRVELALLAATRAGSIQVPLVEVDFVSQGLPEVGVMTSLETPHRLADAILRDCTHNGTPFRKTAEGKVLDTATTANATDLFGLCPTALLLGLWDSAGPRGGLGTKFQRALVSEITGINIQSGVRPSSRIDPLAIQLNAGPVYRTPAGGITLDPQQALQKDKKPVLYAKNKKGEDVPFDLSGKKEVPDEGRPSKANHGNVTPSLRNSETKQAHHGGVTMDYALQTVVISLPALRRLRFPLAGKEAPAANAAARAALAALGLCGATLAIAAGCDLRSRCLLVPVPGQCGWEVVRGDGAAEAFTLDAVAACRLLTDAVAGATDAGLLWRTEPLRLTPSAGLVALVTKSRELAMSAAAEAI